MIIINDASADNTQCIIDQYLQYHPSLIKAVSLKSQKGVSVARNIGLDNIAGEYFLFLDADDYLEPDALQQLYDAAKKYQCDLVKGNNDILLGDKRFSGNI